MDSCKLSGADYFLLALNRHVEKQAGPGYVCRFVMVLEGLLPKKNLELAIDNSLYFQLLQRVYLHNPSVGMARWKLGKTQNPLPVHVSTANNETIPDQILERNIDLNGRSLCEFDVIHVKDSRTVLVFSWHHLLMDGFGVNKLLASLQKDFKADRTHFFPSEVKEGLWQQWKQLVFAKDFLRAISKPPLVEIKADQSRGKSGYLVCHLSDGENHRLQNAARPFSKGAIHTPYHLACATLAFQKVLRPSNKYSEEDLFVPVPMETRKRGASGPVLTNQHSMLFFRIRGKLEGKAGLVKEISTQLFDQVRQGMPSKYAAMTRMLRLIPTWFYYRLIKRPNGDSLAAFLFSQSPSPDNLKNFLGHRLVDATALPPNTAPPGISFQIMTFEGKLKLVLQYSEGCITQEEAGEMISKFKKELLGEDE